MDNSLAEGQQLRMDDFATMVERAEMEQGLDEDLCRPVLMPLPSGRAGASSTTSSSSAENSPVILWAEFFEERRHVWTLGVYRQAENMMGRLSSAGGDVDCGDWLWVHSA
eukprot:16445624-Heterocapsa_arctica.AAC.1